MKIFLLDHEDSFVHNVKHYFEQLGCYVFLHPQNTPLKHDLLSRGFTHIVLSPGPGRPEMYSPTYYLVEKYWNKLPILGICLGHQYLGLFFGLKVEKGITPIHGKTSTLFHHKKGLFEKLPNFFKVARYHSLVLAKDFVPSDIIVDATDQDGSIMAIRHQEFPLYGLQFHPEAYLSEHGFDLFCKFLQS